METKRSGRPRWLLVTAGLAVLAGVLRRWQLATAFEGELRLPIPLAPASMALGCTLVIAGAAFGLLANVQRVVKPPRGDRRRDRWNRALSAPGDLIGLGVMVLAAFLMLLAAPLLFREGWSMWQAFRLSVAPTGNNGVLLMAAGATALAGCGGVLAVARACYRGEGHGKGAIVLPALHGCLWLMELYRGHAADPVLWDYVPMLLAVVGGMLLYMDWGGLSSGRPRPRRTLWLAGMTAVFTAVALAGSWQWGEGLLLVAQLVLAFVVLNRLPVNLEHPTWAARVSIPEPEGRWPGPESGAEPETDARPTQTPQTQPSNGKPQERDRQEEATYE
ncbi:MAG TPA: hypothetical protein IAC21_01345 [Candidatus Enterenecus merdae]|nr:hypothetical protein [Candidatus Enterenecus merdae]